jgi:spermidine/putrescine transport system ATP-binding protein
MSLLKIQDLCFSYGDNPVLNNLTLEIEEGEFISLLGPSGCGKTTVLLLIAGFVKPESGVIKIEGEVLNDVPAYQRNMGMVFQNYALFPHMKVIDNVAYGLRQRRLSKKEAYKRAEEALDLVQLEGMARRSPSQLSGGQQQRVALARAIVIKPRLLLLDEPLSALDRKLRVEMQVELRRIQREVGITTLFVTHDQEEALTLSDRVALVREGAIVQYDKPAVIYEQPKDAFVAGFLGMANFLEGNIHSVQQEKYTLKLGNGKLLPFEANQTLSIGLHCTLAVRPEKVTISEHCTGETPIPGTVSLVTYAGGITQYGVRALDVEWIIQSQNISASGVPFEVGDEIWFGWKKENSLVLKS